MIRGVYGVGKQVFRPLNKQHYSFVLNFNFHYLQVVPNFNINVFPYTGFLRTKKFCYEFIGFLSENQKVKLLNNCFTLVISQKNISLLEEWLDCKWKTPLSEGRYKCILLLKNTKTYLIIKNLKIFLK